MGSGQKAWAEELDEQLQADREKKLEALGFHQIANTVDDIDQYLRQLESMALSLPRSGWRCITELKRLVETLK